MTSAASGNPDVVVIGAGPAGLSAALWCAELGLHPLVLEASDAPGGQLLRIPGPVAALPGLPGIDGRTLLATLLGQLAEKGVPVETGARARVFLGDDDDGDLTVVANGRVFLDVHVILATGVRRRRLEIAGDRAGEAPLVGVVDNVGPDPAAWAGRRVVIVGGGDDACEHALLLAPHAASVTVLHRGAGFSARQELRAPVLNDLRLDVRFTTRVTALLGAPALTGVRLEDGTEIPCDSLFRCIGPVPAGDDLAVPRAPDGSVLVDRLQRTALPGVFAVGDLCAGEAPTVPTAFGQGATAAKTLVAWREGRLDWEGPGVARTPRGGMDPATVPGEALRRGPPPPPPQESTRRPDTLRIEGLRFPARIGAYAWEEACVQALVFDLAFEIDAARAAKDDALRDTLDYAEVARCVEGILAAGHIRLVETVAERVARAILSGFPVTRVSVRVRKPDVPVAGASAVVEIVRTSVPRRA